MSYLAEQIAILQKAAKEGPVNDQILENGKVFYETCAKETPEGAITPAAMFVLQVTRRFYDAVVILEGLKERWNGDIQQRSSSWFSKGDKLLVADYKVFGEQGLIPLVRQLNMDVKFSNFKSSEMPYLLAYVQTQVLIRLLLALHHSDEDAAAYPAAFAGIKNHFGAETINGMLADIKNRF